jgi:hypothetical protein
VLEQLAPRERRNWKIIIACRSEKTDMLQKLKGNKLIAEAINLPPLDEVLSKTLLKSLLKDSGDETLLSAAYRHTNGIPGWLYLIADMISQKMVEENKSIDDIAARYIESCIKKLPANQQNDAMKILQWTALWNGLSFDVDTKLDKRFCFLEKEKIHETLAHDILKHFATAGLAKNFGLDKQKYKIQPEIIREHILAERLFDKLPDGVYKPNKAGQDLIKQLINGEIPEPETVLRSLTRLCKARLEKALSYHFLKPLFDVMVSITTATDDVIIQTRLLEFVENIGPADPESALDVLISIRKNPTSDKEVDVPLWGKTVFSHKNVIAKIPWILFQLAEYVSDNIVAKRYLCEFKELLDYDISTVVESGKSVNDQFQRLL